MDADYAFSLDDCWSTSGYFIKLGPTLITWSLKKQSVVARSGTEVEYCSLAITTVELLWIQTFFMSLSFRSITQHCSGVIIKEQSFLCLSYVPFSHVSHRSRCSFSLRESEIPTAWHSICELWRSIDWFAYQVIIAFSLPFFEFSASSGFGWWFSLNRSILEIMCYTRKKYFCTYFSFLSDQHF